MEIEKKPVVLSGITPTGILTFGHLTGAIFNWVKLQEEYDCFYMVADLHAITVRQEAADLRKRTLDTAAMFLACGIDPEKSALFIQSQVPAHSQLAWVLNTFTGMGECSKMTQFKDKSQKHSENVNVGLFAYPVLQAADILLYQADKVPVGEDQKQHLELSRNLAQRFNHYYSDTFKMPDPLIPKIGAKIMNLQEPTKKMSKSDDDKCTLYLNDPREVIISKIKRSVTDSGTEVKYDTENKPGISNLITMYHVATGKSIQEIENEFAGEGYGVFKPKTAEIVADYLAPIREKFELLRSDKKQLQDILALGAEKANRAANKTLRKVYKKVGFVPAEF